MLIYGNSCSKKIYGGEEYVEASNEFQLRCHSGNTFWENGNTLVKQS